MRDRLIELIKQGNGGYDFMSLERIADHLLANGVIVPKCKIGQDIYRIGSKGQIYGEWQVAYIQVYEDEILYIDDSDNYFYASDIGKTVFLTKEEAEVKLKGAQ
jgi:hypothetical protein